MKTNRRNFIRQITAAGIASSIPSFLFSQQKKNQQMIWADLLHLSYNMWEDSVPLNYRDPDYNCNDCQSAREWAHGYRPDLTFDQETWDALLTDMAASGINMVVIDLGDAIQYQSHPEIAVNNAWAPEKLRSELAKARKLGLEPVPKLNFATTHDIWLGEYSRMVSTTKYYSVCRDLISEVIEIFDNPRLFHLGMDEETAQHQRRQNYAVIRQNDLWWGDLYFYIGECEKKGVRPWVWSDYAWHHPDLFFRKMPKSVMQSNWYYGAEFDTDKLGESAKTHVNLYNDLEAAGYDQIPTGSNHSNDENMEGTVNYCKKIIDPSRLYGFMTAPWRPTLASCLERHKQAMDQVERSINNFNR
jgi:hypothetical protein